MSRILGSVEGRRTRYRYIIMLALSVMVPKTHRSKALKIAVFDNRAVV